MGDVPGGKTGDATKANVVAAAKETAPVKMAEQIKKGLDAAKGYRSQLRSQNKGTGAREAEKPVLPDAPENMQFPGKRPANPEYKLIDENGNLTEYGKWFRDPDPNNPVEIKYTDEWDIGHKPGHKFRKHQKDAAKREIGCIEFLDE